MRIISRLSAWAAVAVIAATGIAVGSAGPAAAAECPVGEREPVQVITVPALPNAPLSIFGSPVALSEAGTGTVQACPDSIIMDLDIDPEPFAVGERTQARYDRVFATDRGRAISVAFHLDYLTALELVGTPTLGDQADNRVRDIRFFQEIDVVQHLLQQ